MILLVALLWSGCCLPGSTLQCHGVYILGIVIAALTLDYDSVLCACFSTHTMPLMTSDWPVMDISKSGPPAQPVPGIIDVCTPLPSSPLLSSKGDNTSSGHYDRPDVDLLGLMSERLTSSPLPLLLTNNMRMTDPSHPPHTVCPCPQSPQMAVIRVCLAGMIPNKPYNPMTLFPMKGKYTQQSLPRTFKASGVTQGTQRGTSY
jgi:hypothetical protein